MLIPTVKTAIKIQAKGYQILNGQQQNAVTAWETVCMPGPEVIKLFSCSTQMSMKFSPLIYVKMPTIVGILTCMSGKNSILGLSEPKKC